jgi:hypothetical protein
LERLAARHGSSALVNYGRTLGQLSRLHVPAMHDSGYIGTGVGVCVLDEGFNFYRKHERSAPSSSAVGARGTSSVA